MGKLNFTPLHLFLLFLYPHQSLRAPAVFTTRLSRVLGRSTVSLNSILGPGGHVSLGYFAAASQTGHLARRQDSVPEPNLGQFSNQGLGCVETSTRGILEGKKSTFSWTTKTRIKRDPMEDVSLSYSDKLSFCCSVALRIIILQKKQPAFRGF